MSPVTYCITEETCFSGGTEKTSYGIAAYEDGDNGTIAVLAAIHDISTDKEKLAEFVHTCNRLNLSTLHLHDAVEDFLAQ